MIATLCNPSFSLGKSLGIEVVAEGVETEADMQTLRRLGCSTMQGYYFAKPMPQHETIEWINRSDHSSIDGTMILAAQYPQ